MSKLKVTFFVLLFILALSSFYNIQAQDKNVNGKVIYSASNLTILQVWGTHYERGFAQGYFFATKVVSLYRNFIASHLRNDIQQAKDIISDTNNFKIDSIYIEEAKGMIDGMEAAVPDITIGLDYNDIFIGTAYRDIAKLLNTGVSDEPPTTNNFCSTLISWGEATAGTSLNGKTAVTHHCDNDLNDIDTCLVNNQVMVIHYPTDSGEQPWLMVGWAGQLGIYQGTNKAGVSIFLDAMNNVGYPQKGNKYEPTLLTVRKGLETIDFNKDGMENTEDFKAIVLNNPHGFAYSSIFSVCTKSTEIQDSLIALMIEATYADPILTFRTNSYEDKMPSDNLYAANNSIKRKDSRLYCDRYNMVASHIGTGLNIDSLSQWNLMHDYSSLEGNLQFMQIIPELNKFKLAVRTLNTPAYMLEPLYFDLNELFKIPSDVKDGYHVSISNYSLEQNYPNPFNPSTNIRFSVPNSGLVNIKVYNLLGQKVAGLVNEIKAAGTYNISFNAYNLPSGIYFYTIRSGNFNMTKKMMLLK